MIGVQFMEEKWPHCYSYKFTGISKKENKLLDFKCNFLEKINFVQHLFAWTETRRKQPMPTNFGAKIFNYALKQTVVVS